MQKYIITSVAHYTTDRDGNKLRTKDGRDYTRCIIKVAEHGSQQISGFGNNTTKSWKEGDTVEANITEKKSFDGLKTYFNFELPKRELTGGQVAVGLSDEDRNLLTSIAIKVAEVHAWVQEQKAIASQAPTIEPEEMPDFPKSSQ